MSQLAGQWPIPSPQNIIVRMPNWLGDLVMATPVLALLRGQYPEARITAMCLAHFGGVLESDPHLDEIFQFTRPSGWIHHAEHHEVIYGLQAREYDLGVILPNSFTSAWWFWRGKVGNRLGFAGNGRSWLLNKALPFPLGVKTQHLVLTYQALLAPLGIETSDTQPKLYVDEADEQRAREALLRLEIDPRDVIIGINPGAAFGSAKCWLPERFEELTQRLLQNVDCKILYFGDAAGASLVNRICEGKDARVVNLAGKTSIRELMAYIKLCKVLVTNDSGPMHLAAALGTPPLALFGSTSDVRTGPYGLGRVIHKHVDCSPCYKRVCPIDFRCMKRIEVEEVYTTIQEMLRDAKR